MLEIVDRGSFDNSTRFLKAMLKLDPLALMSEYGAEGVHALERATPRESGLAARSWYYEVKRKGDLYTITWFNSDVENGFPVAIMLQYGYGTGTGGYVHGRDYINPAIQPVFDQIAEKVWKVVTSS
jgi:hypothetical protein